MSTFSVKIIKILEEYKEILRSFMPLKVANARISCLGLINKKMLCASDLVLYKIANKTMADLQDFIKKANTKLPSYPRLQNYYEDLQKAIQEFCVDGDRVINPQQETSRLALEVIQVLSLSPEKINSTLRARVDACMEKIHQYGSLEQYQKLEILIAKKIVSG
jgi:hypothetical protein